jgi:hypothetical protein
MQATQGNEKKNHKVVKVMIAYPHALLSIDKMCLEKKHGAWCNMQYAVL